MTHVNANIFDWRPERRYDAVFFGFWLSHVPPATFHEFWALVRSSLRAGGPSHSSTKTIGARGNDDIHLVGNVPAAVEPSATGERSTS